MSHFAQSLKLFNAVFFCLLVLDSIGALFASVAIMFVIIFNFSLAFNRLENVHVNELICEILVPITQALKGEQFF